MMSSPQSGKQLSMAFGTSVCDVGGKHHLCPQPVMLQCQAQQSGRCGLDDGLLDAPCAVADGADS
jgi:hypothetical protein